MLKDSSSLQVKRLAVALGLVLVVFLSGCANYQLGTGTASFEFQSIYVAPVSNESSAPQIVGPVSRAVRNQFVADGRLSLSPTPDSADLAIDIVLTSYLRDFTAVLPNDTALARKFEITLVAKCTLHDQRLGKVLFTDREIRVTRQIFVDDGQNPAEFQVIPQLADQLADRIAHAVLDVW